MRSLSLRALAVAIGIALALGIAELGLRALAEDRDPPPSIGLLEPTTSVDPHFRKWVPKPEKKPDRFRVLVLGDSFAWGWGVRPELTWVTKLARWLRQLESGEHFEVVNWSRPGWNTWEEWISIRDRLDEWSPDLLVLGYVLNDAEPTDLEERARRRTELVRQTPEAGVGAALYRRSLLARRLYDALENRRLRRELTAYYHALYREEGWSRARLGLESLQSAADQLDIPLVVVLFPIFDLEDGYAYRQLHELLLDTTRELGIRSVDLLPIYDGIDRRQLVVEPFTDAHPSPLAHRLAARTILEHLAEEELIPARLPR